MDWLTKILNYIGVTSGSSTSSPSATKSSKKPLFNGSSTQKNPNEIGIVNELSDEQIRINEERSKYLTVVKNQPHTVKQGDNIFKIAQKYGVPVRAIYAANGLDENSAKNLKLGAVIKIPDSKKIKNVKNLTDIAKAMGVSVDFIKKLKKIEDSDNLAENKFHNTPYPDAGTFSIGIGHRIRPEEKDKLKYLSDTQVCELCAKDLLEAEENIIALVGGENKYKQIPQSLKEAVLDLTYNKGVVDDDSYKGLIFCLKNGKWEAAINKLTFNKSISLNKEMSGLSKRRLFDIALATKMYKGKIPQSNINTAQQVYNRGIELLRAECKKDGKNFENQLAGYNKDVQSYLGNNIKLITK